MSNSWPHQLEIVQPQDGVDTLTHCDLVKPYGNEILVNIG